MMLRAFMGHQRAAPEFGLLAADEEIGKGRAGQERAGCENDERQPHGPRRLVRVFQHALRLPGLALEDEEHQPPGIERGEQRRDQRCEEGKQPDRRHARRKPSR